MSSSRTRPSRFARFRSVIALVAAVALTAWFAADHRAELEEIYETITGSLPFSSQAGAAPESGWLQSGPASINPQQLANLDIAKQYRSDDDYERAEFGDGWESTGGGCDVRDTILDRDLVEVTYEDGSDCEVTGGTLHDPYTGAEIAGNLSETVQVDHIVSLADAWYSGAEEWSAEKRESFANAPGNLVAVEAGANMSKSDASISEWYPDWDAPSETAQCRYAAQYVDVLSTYDLSVTSDDYKLLKKLETDCKDLA